MIEFFLSNWKVIALFIALTIYFIVLLSKKKVTISSIFEMVLMVLPNYISEAEYRFSEGSEKYSYVFNRVLEYLMVLTGESKNKIVENFATKIDVAIENILNTPQKKKGVGFSERSKIEQTRE